MRQVRIIFILLGSCCALLISNASAAELHSNAQIRFTGANIPVEPNNHKDDGSGMFINGPVNNNQNDKRFGYVATQRVESTVPKLPNSGVILTSENNIRVLSMITVLFGGVFILKRRKREK